jgi:hypothetical protein
MMRRILLAIRVFFLTLFSAEAARRVDEALGGELPPAPPAEKPKPKPKGPPGAKPPARSDALTLLATLQREARFVDFIQEPLEGYADAQIGAAARDVHRECAAVLARLFDFRPVVGDEEGAAVDVPPGFDAGKYRLVGNVTGEPPYRGKLAHHGWQAAKCELPEWTGSPASSRIVAPVEVELT